MGKVLPHMSNGAMYSTNHWQSNSSSPRMVSPFLVVRVSQTAGVTLAVLGLSWDDYPTPGIPSGRVSQNTGVNNPWDPSVRVSRLEQSRDDYPTTGTLLTECNSGIQTQGLR